MIRICHLGLTKAQKRVVVLRKEDCKVAISSLTKSVIKSLDLAGWANSVNDGETERSQVEEMIHKYLTTSGIRYQGKSEMERMEQEIKRWFESQLF